MNYDRYGRWLWSIAALATVAIVAFSAFVLFRPMPPCELVLATGPSGSAYEEAGKRYQALLNDERSGVSAGFVQSGTTSAAASAELVERLAVGLLPIVGVLYPLWSLAPRAFAWYMNRRIYRQYMEFKWIEREAHRRGSGALAADLEERLRLLVLAVTNLQAPAAYAPAKYHLQAHVNLVAQSLREGTP